MSKRSLLAKVGAPVAVLALFAGCSPSPATAIELDGVKVSESTIGDYAEGCRTIMRSADGTPSTEGDARRLTVSMVGNGMIADKLVAQYGVAAPTSDQLAEAQARMTNLKPAFDQSSCNQAAQGAVKLMALALSQADRPVLRDAEAISPVVNPRYGTWNPELLTVDGTGSLSELGLGA